MSPVLPARGSLSRVIPLSHHLISEVLRPGDLALDLTAGNGGDTLFLWNCVAPRGRVLAFDIQPLALANTKERIAGTGAPVFNVVGQDSVGESSGVWLILEDHARLKNYLVEKPKGIIANLGYHPGGDRAVITRGDTTVRALQAAAEMLLPGGRLVIVPYIGHPGGAEEAREATDFFSRLPAPLWTTLQITFPNRLQSPFILMAEKRSC